MTIRRDEVFQKEFYMFFLLKVEDAQIVFFRLSIYYLEHVDSKSY